MERLRFGSNAVGPNGECTPLVMPGHRFGFEAKIKPTNNSELFFSPQWITNQVTQERQKPQQLRPWYNLGNFFVREQVSQLVRNTQGTIGEVAPDVLEIELAKVRIDIQAFEKEYMEQMLTLRFKLAWEGEGKDRHIVCPDYGNVSWQSVTGSKEREGAVLEAVVGAEEFLKDAPPESFAIVTSPRGWSNLETADGDEIKFPETQVYAIKTLADGTLQAYTFRYDADILENEDFQEQLGLSVAFEPNQKRRIKNALTNTALIRGDDPDRKVKSFEDIIGVMQESVGGREIAYEEKSFDEFASFLQNPDQYTLTNPYTEQLITRFNDYTRWRIGQGGTPKDLAKDLEIALALTVLQINKLYRQNEQQTEGQTGERRRITQQDVARLAKQPRMNYQEEKQDLEKRGGCAGGGSGNINSMGTIRKGIIDITPTKNKSEKETGEDDYEFDHKGECVVCKKDPELLGPCDICVSCDASMGGKGAKMAA